MRISVRPRLEFSIMRNTIVLAAPFAALLAAVLPSGAASAGTVVQAAAEPAAKPALDPAAAQVYFIWPHDGTVISGGKFWVRMGLRNMGVAPKGTAVPNTGHHHLLVDTELPSMTEPIPNDRNHLHFGAGETEARVELPPGKHTLQLLLGDMNHVPHKPPVLSKKITVTVR
jgi:hypothetical protein